MNLKEIGQRWLKQRIFVYSEMCEIVEGIVINSIIGPIRSKKIMIRKTDYGIKKSEQQDN